MLKQTDGAIITSIKEFFYNILDFRKNSIFDIGVGVDDVIYKNRLILINTETTSFNSHLSCKVINKIGVVSLINIYRSVYPPKHSYILQVF